MYSLTVLAILIGWLVVQGFVAATNFYTVTTSVPPRFLWLVLPPLLFIIGLFLSAKGRSFISNLSQEHLALLHTIRIPVEIVLFQLYLHKMVPQLMTFEGRNFDILSGISAIFVYLLGYRRKMLGKKGLLIWNFLALALLMNIVINAVLSTPFRFQQFGFEQPNIAVLYFPFVWLPGCIVPLVLFSHLSVIYQLLAAAG